MSITGLSRWQSPDGGKALRSCRYGQNKRNSKACHVMRFECKIEDATFPRECTWLSWVASNLPGSTYDIEATSEQAGASIEIN